MGDRGEPTCTVQILIKGGHGRGRWGVRFHLRLWAAGVEHAGPEEGELEASSLERWG